jgi:hypothetical protein
MPTFVSGCTFLPKYVAFGSLNNLRNVKKFFLP